MSMNREELEAEVMRLDLEAQARFLKKKTCICGLPKPSEG